MNQIVSMAANEVHGNAHAKCATTMIWLGLGPENDPRIKYCLDQVKMWFDLNGSIDPILVSRAWWEARQAYHASPHPWSTVKGLIGATIGALDTIGWNGISPFKWIDQNGDIWKQSDTASHFELLADMRKQIEAQI